MAVPDILRKRLRLPVIGSRLQTGHRRRLLLPADNCLVGRRQKHRGGSAIDQGGGSEGVNPLTLNRLDRLNVRPRQRALLAALASAIRFSCSAIKAS
jgi:hypothetical protein